MRRVFAAALILGIALVAWAADQAILQRITAASANLTAFQATIAMAKYTGQRAEIEFTFAFVPPDKMRIEYLAPPNLKGQLVILNGDELYTYLPVLHRAVRKRVAHAAENPGTEMGFLYYFVDRDIPDFLTNNPLVSVEGPEEISWKQGDTTVTYRAYKLTLGTEKEKQVVWCDASSLVPVAVDIYRDGKLPIRVRVLSYEYNGEIPAEAFTIPG